MEGSALTVMMTWLPIACTSSLERIAAELNKRVPSGEPVSCTVKPTVLGVLITSCGVLKLGSSTSKATHSAPGGAVQVTPVGVPGLKYRLMVLASIGVSGVSPCSRLGYAGNKSVVVF